MTKEEILNGMSEQEFYSLYPTKQAWEMAVGGTPFGAGIMLQQGGPKSTTIFPTFNSRSAYDKFKAGNPNFNLYSDSDMEGLGVDVPTKPLPYIQNPLPYAPAGQTPTGAGLFNNPKGQQFTFSNGTYNPYSPTVTSPIVNKKKGGDITDQGANQDFIKERNNKYNSFIQTNVMKNLQEEEAEKVQNAFMQMEYGMHAMPDGTMMPDNQMQTGGVNYENLALQHMYQQRIDGRENGLNYFPANIGRSYEFSNKDYSKLASMTENDQLSGAGVKYGAMARLLGKTGRRMFGPKEIYMDFLRKPTAYNQSPQVDLSMKAPQSESVDFPMNDTKSTSPYTPYAEQSNQVDPMQTYIPKKIYMDSQLQQNSKGGLLKKYQQMGEVYNNPVAMENNWSFTGAPAPIDYREKAFGPNGGVDNVIMKGDDPVTDRVTMKRKTTGLKNTIGQWAIPAVNKIAQAFENKDLRKNQEKLDELMLADNAFITQPLNNKDRGDYDLNSGMFRMDQHVPVQFPGYAQFGGSLAEGEELDLSPEEIEALKAQGYELENLD